MQPDSHLLKCQSFKFPQIYEECTDLQPFRFQLYFQLPDCFLIFGIQKPVPLRNQVYKQPGDFCQELQEVSDIAVFCIERLAKLNRQNKRFGNPPNIQGWNQ